MGTEWFALMVPIILSVTALLLFRHKLVWWEVLLPVVICIGTIAGMKALMVKYLTNDTEYISEYITETRYYEDWNEYVHRTCTRTVSCGKNCTRTVTYDCSYVRYHSEYWEIRTNMGNKYRISKKYFDYLTKLFGNKAFKDLYRHYYTNDGDMYKSLWNREFGTLRPMTFEHTYQNKPQSVNSVFKFRELDSVQKKGLYSYPDVVDRTQKACLGCNEEEDLLLRRYNSLWGKRFQVKVYLLVFDGKSIEVAERQRSFWKGGNKNELVICMDREGKWAKSFSWCDNKEIEVQASLLLMDSANDLPTGIIALQDKIEKHWKRKEFSDFDYIKVPLTNNQHIWLYVTVTLLSIGMLVYGVLNEIEQY